ncbi:MAG: hypothetical protein HQK72_10555 [Desulfamplus sp.]|nr:hypothetical protein [Desulfamplus sp.]
MTRKITLSIPDMLYEKMEEWRQSFNFSKMFQDALAEAIHKKEEFQRRLQEDHDMAAIIDRLKNEKKQAEVNYSENGHAKGLQWAKNAHYNDLIYALGLSSALEMAKDDTLGSYFNNLLSSEELVEKKTDGIGKYGRLFLDGWRRGVRDFWNEIKEKI